MSIRVSLWPWWARFVILACLCAAGLSLLAAFGSVGGSWSQAAPGIALVSLAVGAVGTAASQRGHRAYTDAVDGLSAADRSAALTALLRGPLPTAPAVRAATTRVGKVYLDAAERSWSMIVVTAPILILLFAVVAVAEVQAGEPTAAAPYGVLALLIAAGTAWSWYMPRQVRRRLDLLL
ncbi:hypothetical protein ACAG26_14485 [Mycobacterium sp. pUA109]|uniref:hypothetical protein n=1 Tax=Mycobacterium sp. pUA109 TaxID=3238982 RepID=UPI00351B9F2E